MLCFPITLLTDVISKKRCSLCAKHMTGAESGALWGEEWRAVKVPGWPRGHSVDIYRLTPPKHTV